MSDGVINRVLCFIPNVDFGSSPDTRSLEERLDDATEELDIGEFFGKPSRDRFDESTRYSLGMNTIQFDTSSLHETPQNRQEFVQGSVPTKRRRTTTPEEDDLLQAHAMSELTISRDDHAKKCHHCTTSLRPTNVREHDCKPPRSGGFFGAEVQGEFAVLHHGKCVAVFCSVGAGSLGGVSGGRTAVHPRHCESL